MKKRVLVALLCLTLLISFVACDMEFGGLVGELFSQGVGDYVPSDDFIPGPSIEETWIETEIWIEETTPGLELPENVYPGESVTILGSDYGDLGSPEVLSGIVHELSYQRNKMVEDAFNIHINTEYCSWTDIADKVKVTVQTGSPDYDIVMAEIALTGAPLALDGYLANLNTLPYVNMSSSAWDADVKEGLAIGSYLPMATGALVPSSDMLTAMIAFHKQMADEMGVDMYDYVACGGWTLAKMHAFVNETYVDLNGNGQADRDDRFGLALEGDRTYAFACGADAMLIGKDANNLPVLNDTGMDRMLQAYDEFYAMILRSGTLYLPTHSFTATGKQEPQMVFENGRAFLYGTTVENAFSMQEMGVEFGMLPYPKLNEEQESYRSFVSTAASAVMVPLSARDHGLAGYALEALAQTSNGLYRDRISTKVCPSAQDVEMMMLVWETKTLDFGSNYLMGEMNLPVQYFGKLLDTNSGTFATWYAQYQKTFQKALEQVVEAYNKLG